MCTFLSVHPRMRASISLLSHRPGGCLQYVGLHLHSSQDTGEHCICFFMDFSCSGMMWVFLLPAQRGAAVKQALLETSKPRSQCLVLEEALHGAISRVLVTGAWHCLERHLCKVCLWHATYKPTLVHLLNKQLSLNIKLCWWDRICCVRLLALGGLVATLGASWIAFCNPSVVHALHASYRFTGHDV